jgi:hypothetical protein
MSARCPTWDQWRALRELLDFGDEMDAEVWRLNGRKGTPGEAWDRREVIGQSAHKPGIGNGTRDHYTVGGTIAQHVDITAPATDAARQWSGWGTALKPAVEPIVLARKPLSGTVAACVLEHGTGALNIAATRVATSAADAKAMERCNSPKSGRMDIERNGQIGTFERSKPTGALDTTAGRWPSNVLLSHVGTALYALRRDVPDASRPSDSCLLRR